MRAISGCKNKLVMAGSYSSVGFYLAKNNVIFNHFGFVVSELDICGYQGIAMDSGGKLFE